MMKTTRRTYRVVVVSLRTIMAACAWVPFLPQIGYSLYDVFGVGACRGIAKGGIRAHEQLRNKGGEKGDKDMCTWKSSR